MYYKFVYILISSVVNITSQSNDEARTSTDLSKLFYTPREATPTAPWQPLIDKHLFITFNTCTGSGVCGDLLTVRYKLKYRTTEFTMKMFISEYQMQYLTKLVMKGLAHFQNDNYFLKKHLQYKSRVKCVHLGEVQWSFTDGVLS